MSTDTLFNHVAMFTDLHLGLKNNSEIHNNDCQEYIDWFISEARERGAETCVFLGDFHHQRAALNIKTLNHSMEVLRKLNDAFETVYFITGNHDLYYRERRDIHSIPMATLFPNIVTVDKHMVMGEVSFIPWLIEDEWKDATKIKSKYMFGHFEIPGFKMNALVDMPDHGTINRTQFKNQDYVFSGHFHKRQNWQNIHYIGNAFPHNYADVGDNDRGAAFLKWGGEPEFVNWEDCPSYVNTTISELTKNPDKIMIPKSHIRAVVDVDMTYEEAQDVKELFTTKYDIRELKLMSKKDDDTLHEDAGDINFDSVDRIVLEELASIESKTFDTAVLISIYDNLED